MHTSRFFQLFSTYILALVLVVLSFTSLLEAAALRPLWLDEYFGVIVGMFEPDWITLFLKGPNSQGSLHPLYYALDKLIIVPWMPSPQRWWNLFLLFRLTPILSFSLSGALIFLYSVHILKRFPDYSYFPIRLLISTAFALFFYKVQFAEYYAIEARPYSLWLLFSTGHFLLTLEVLQEGWASRRLKLGYASCSLLLCLTASPGIFQLIISFVALQWIHRNLKVIPWILPALSCSVYYMLDSNKWGYGMGGFAAYLSSMKEVAFKSFHARNGFVFFPVFFIGCLQLWAWRKSPKIRSLVLYLACLLALTLALMAACWYKGFLLASRQYIYLIPLYLFIYFIALHAVGNAAANQIKKKFPRFKISWVIGAWAVLIVAKACPELVKRAYQLPSTATRLGFYQESALPECSNPLSTTSEGEFAALNQKCRGLD